MELIKNCILAGVILTIANGLDENSVKERKCEVLTPKTDIDWFWVASVERWYIQLGSKLGIYRMATDFLERKVSEISENLFESACITCDSNMACHGFNKSVAYNVDYDYWNYLIEFKSNSPYALKGKHGILWTDKERELALGTTCWEDEEMSWFLFNSQRTLNEKTKEEILKILSSHGFEMKYVIETPTDKKTCPEAYAHQDKDEL